MSIDTAQIDKIGKLLRSGKMDESQILTMSSASFSIPSDCADPSAYVNHAMNTIHPRLQVLNATYVKFAFLARAYGQSNLEYERNYRALYDDIIQHRDVWFGTILNPDNPEVNPVHAEQSTGILGTLCTLLRQRGALVECNKVMKTYMDVLKCYQRMSDGCGISAQVECCEALTYKANLIRLNLGLQIHERDMAIKAIRDILAYEKKYMSMGRFTISDSDYDTVVQTVIGHNNYDKVSDDDMFKAIKFLYGDQLTESELRTCGFCEKTEKMYGDFKMCARCNVIHYCGRNCQTKDWPCHKQLCKGKNKTKISSESLLSITNIVLQNHTTSVENATKKKVPKNQVLDAKVALIKQLKKMFIEDFPQFNSPLANNDAGSDPDFNQALAEFFAKQPGYETWKKIRVGLADEMRENDKKLRSNGVIKVDDETLREMNSKVLQDLVLRMGFITGNGLELVDKERNDKLVEDMIGVAKTIALKYPEYNSYVGVRKMNENDEYKKMLQDLICDAFGIE